MTSASASGTPSVPFSPEHHFFRGREGGGVIKPGKGGRDRGRQSGGEGGRRGREEREGRERRRGEESGRPEGETTPVATTRERHGETGQTPDSQKRETTTGYQSRQNSGQLDGRRGEQQDETCADRVSLLLGPAGKNKKPQSRHRLGPEKHHDDADDWLRTTRRSRGGAARGGGTPSSTSTAPGSSARWRTFCRREHSTVSMSYSHTTPSMLPAHAPCVRHPAPAPAPAPAPRPSVERRASTWRALRGRSIRSTTARGARALQAARILATLPVALRCPAAPPPCLPAAARAPPSAHMPHKSEPVFCSSERWNALKRGSFRENGYVIY